MDRFGIIVLLAASALELRAQVSAPHWRGNGRAWRHDVPCLATVAPLHDCVEMRGGRRVCRHHLSEEEADEITIEQGSLVLHRWKIDVGLAGGDDSGGHFYRADLDGDGAPELILTTLEAVSNGYAIQTVQIDVIDGHDAAMGPLHFEVEDFDPQISFLRAPHSRQCRLFATEWRWSIDRKRGWGHYLVGEWLDYHAGELRHTTARPVLARRRLFSFQRAMARGNIYDWLRDSRAEALPASPPDHEGQDAKIKVVRGAVQSFDGSTVFIRTGSIVQPLAAGTIRVIDGRTGRLFPAAYHPPSRQFDHKHVVIRSRGWPPEQYSEVLIRVIH